MAAPVLKQITPEEYLEIERTAENKHEYIRGEVIAMAGASLIHNTIVSNVIGTIYPFLKNKSCNIYPSDLRVSVSSAELYTYPDATIVCDEPQMPDGRFDTITNPSVIFEIISPSTEDYDRGRKFFFYMQIPSLKEYILINSTNTYVQAARRQADGSWKFEDIRDMDATLSINTIGQSVPLKDIYANVVW